MVKRIIDKYGRRLAIDSSLIGKTSQGVSIIRELSIGIDDLSPDDEGSFFNLTDDAGDTAGGGSGLYYYEDAAFKKVGGGECNPIVCTNGHPILRGQQIKGARFIPLTSSEAVVFRVPIFQDGYPGQEIVLMNVGPFDIELHAESIQADSNVKLAADIIRLKGVAPGNDYSGGLRLVYSAVVGAWVQVGTPVDVSLATMPKIIVGKGTLALTGSAPGIRALILRTPTVGALTLGIAASAPSVRHNSVRLPTGAILTTITTQAGIAGRIAPSTGSVGLTGRTSTLT